MANDSGITMSRDPAQIVDKIAGAFTPTDADLLYAGNRQKVRILDRTARGLDVDGHQFAPYKDAGPYYWYPSQATKDRVAARNRFFKKGAEGASKTGIGIKFANYAAAKLAVVGESFVNLMGFRAPHMLQGIVVKVRSGLLTIGIYGEEAVRANAHNEGTKHLPKRRFFAASADDERLMSQDVFDSASKRVENVK